MTESEQLAYMTEAYAASQREIARLHAAVHTLGADLELANKRARKAEDAAKRFGGTCPRCLRHSVGRTA